MELVQAHTTLVVIPTYNERGSLEGLVESVLSRASDVEVLIVDDASPDGTGTLADELAQADRRIHVLHRAAKSGMGTAYVSGFEWARAHGFRRVAQMDADGSHDPGALDALIARLADADLVIGSRAVRGGGTVGWGLHRSALSRLASAYCRAFLGWELKDPTSGYRALGERALDAISDRPIRSEGFAFQIEVAYRVVRAGLVVAEHPILFRDREVGRSKLSMTIVAEAIVVVPLLRLCNMVGA